MRHSVYTAESLRHVPETKFTMAATDRLFLLALCCYDQAMDPQHTKPQISANSDKLSLSYCNLNIFNMAAVCHLDLTSSGF